uniref:Uncharacterized protein n=1 Tax=Rhizophora mucronata TaxID=61149 RepID=A0A2P2PWX6_RHIMU
MNSNFQDPMNYRKRTLLFEK